MLSKQKACSRVMGMLYMGMLYLLPVCLLFPSCFFSLPHSNLHSFLSHHPCFDHQHLRRVFVEVVLSSDRRLLTINCNSKSSSEVWLIDVNTPGLEPILVQPRQPQLLYHVEHWRCWLIILANTGPGQEYQVECAHMYCSTLPDVADQHSDLEFLVSSPVRPPVPYCLHLKDGLILLGTEEDGTSRENQGNYTTTRLEAHSQDGTLVPVTVLHAESVECLKEAPLLVHVYGAYGRDLNMEFCPERRLLMELGWALAYCHIRGGGERGLSWHRQACEEGKQRGLEDLRACLQHLFSSGISSPLLTALTSCSAGAVPVGALCNTNPHLMRAVILQAPFLDVLGTMQDPRLPLTVEEREEWGDPLADQQHRLTIASYCPLHNITPQRYPSMLLTAYSGDARVPLAGVIQYTERLHSPRFKCTHYLSLSLSPSLTFLLFIHT
uniref:Prolyl endopeptidase n=1 Tax=Myripristis murdjan TaxID=586833 RepID=A0A667XIF9_9TELE